jgi:hypothetical protein
MKRIALVAAIWLVTSAQVQQLPQPEPDACMVSVVNTTDIPILVGLVHGDVEMLYESQILMTGGFLRIKVPCNGPDSLTLFAFNASNPQDFQANEIEIPPAGMLHVWCLGPACAKLKPGGPGPTNLRITT